MSFSIANQSGFSFLSLRPIQFSLRLFRLFPSVLFLMMLAFGFCHPITLKRSRIIFGASKHASRLLFSPLKAGTCSGLSKPYMASIQPSSSPRRWQSTKPKTEDSLPSNPTAGDQSVLHKNSNLATSSKEGSLPADGTLKITENSQRIALSSDDDNNINKQLIDDSLLVFEPVAHVYTYAGHRLRYSVTQIISSYFEKFDPDRAIEQMMSSVSWPRPQYQHADGRAFTPTEIRAQWDTIGRVSREKGTEMHTVFESFFDELLLLEKDGSTPAPPAPMIRCSPMQPEYLQFLEFYARWYQTRHLRVRWTERRIVAPDLGIAGSVDYIGLLPPDGSGEDRYVLLDWKRSKDLATNAFNNFGKFAKPPLAHVPDCDGSKYSLQLNLYAYILRHYYGINVVDMYIVSFHPQQLLPLTRSPAGDSQFSSMPKKLSPDTPSTSGTSSSTATTGRDAVSAATPRQAISLPERKTGYFVLPVRDMSVEIEALIDDLKVRQGKEQQS